MSRNPGIDGDVRSRRTEYNITSSKICLYKFCNTQSRDSDSTVLSHSSEWLEQCTWLVTTCLSSGPHYEADCQHLLGILKKESKYLER